MTLSEFNIGKEFWCSDRRWRCTDVGTRVVVAIRVDEAAMTTKHGDGTLTTRILTSDEAEQHAWFSGPPYIVAESVFDEYDLEGCTATRGEQ